MKLPLVPLGGAMAAMGFRDRMLLNAIESIGLAFGGNDSGDVDAADGDGDDCGGCQMKTKKMMMVLLQLLLLMMMVVAMMVMLLVKAMLMLVMVVMTMLYGGDTD